MGLRSRPPKAAGKQREQTEGSPSNSIKPVNRKHLAPTASLDELSTFSSTKELVKQSPGFMLTSPTATPDGGRVGTRAKNPASLLASNSTNHHQLVCLSQTPP